MGRKSRCAAAAASGLRARFKAQAAPLNYLQRRHAGVEAYIEAVPSGHFFGGFALHLRLCGRSWLCAAELDAHRQRVCRAVTTPPRLGATLLFLADPPTAAPDAPLSPLEAGVAALRDNLLGAPLACLLFDFLYQAADALYFLRQEWRLVLVSPAATAFLYLSLCRFDMQNELYSATLFAPRPEFFFKFRELIAAKRLFLVADGHALGRLMQAERLERGRERTLFLLDAGLEAQLLPFLRARMPALEVRRLPSAGGLEQAGEFRGSAQAVESWRAFLGGGQCVLPAQLGHFAQDRVQVPYLLIAGRAHLGGQLLCARGRGSRALAFCVRGRRSFASAAEAQGAVQSEEGEAEGALPPSLALGPRVLLYYAAAPAGPRPSP